VVERAASEPAGGELGDPVADALEHPSVPGADPLGLSARHNAAGRPLAVRLELHQLDGHRILGLLGATTALDQHECAGLRVAWLKGHAKR
jgi:hypothetical protein